MFNNKQSTIFEKPKKTSAFAKAVNKKQAITTSGNEAKKFDSLDDPFTQEFGSLGTYKAPRSFEDISSTMATLWALNSLLTMKLLFYIRLISRIVQFSFRRNSSTGRALVKKI